MSKAATLQDPYDYYLKVTRLNNNTNLLLLYHRAQDSLTLTFDRTTHEITARSRIANPISDFIANAHLFREYIVFVHQSSIYVY